MSGLIEDYLREVETSLRADPDRKRRIVDELRTHLREKVEDTLRASPERPRDEVEREVLHDFGSPRDLALAYETGGAPALRDGAGETALRVGKAVGRGASSAARAVGRGTGRLLKGLAVAFVVLLGVGLVGGVWAYYELKPHLLAMAEDSAPVYAYSQSCHNAPCDVDVTTQTFHVRPDARQMRFVLHLDSTVLPPDPGNATDDLRLRVTDPEGNVRYERSGSLVDAGSIEHRFQWAAVPGNWTVSLSSTQMVGRVDVRIYASSAPWDL